MQRHDLPLLYTRAGPWHRPGVRWPRAMLVGGPKKLFYGRGAYRKTWFIEGMFRNFIQRPKC